MKKGTVGEPTQTVFYIGYICYWILDGHCHSNIIITFIGYNNRITQKCKSDVIYCLSLHRKITPNPPSVSTITFNLIIDTGGPSAG